LAIARGELVIFCFNDPGEPSSNIDLGKFDTDLHISTHLLHISWDSDPGAEARTIASEPTPSEFLAAFWIQPLGVEGGSNEQIGSF
jgi:hypothetical protein